MLLFLKNAIPNQPNRLTPLRFFQPNTPNKKKIAFAFAYLAKAFFPKLYARNDVGVKDDLLYLNSSRHSHHLKLL